jgi:hypothetical protein
MPKVKVVTLLKNLLNGIDGQRMRGQANKRL